MVGEIHGFDRRIWPKEFIPQMDITEDEKAVLVTVELSGTEEKDLRVTLFKN